jgi:alkylation response protein AidB-like acyl-CoA dehydrogenase
VRLTLTEEQRELRDVVRDLIEARADSQAVRTAMSSAPGFDRDLWKQFAEMGLVGLCIPEQEGGAGATPAERAVVCEELGRALVPGPYLATAVLAADALQAAGDAAAMSDYLPAIAAGELIASVAVAEGRQAWPTDGGHTTATSTPGGWVIDGTKTRVVHGDAADLLIVYAAAPGGPAWFAVEPRAGTTSRMVLDGLDHTRRLTQVEFAGAPARALSAADPRAGLARVADQAAVALAAEQVGGHRRLVEMTSEYAKIRVQFGRAIGSFQAVKHGIVDMYCSLELAESVVRYAAWAAAESPGDLSLAAALAQAYVGPAYFEAAASAIQYHGGIGFTWEHDAHLYYKRAKSTELLFGGSVAHQTRLAARLGI